MSGAALNLADQFWLRRFNIAFPFLPTGLEDLFDKVVPELQKARDFPARG
jgi:hypothetical protein